MNVIGKPIGRFYFKLTDSGNLIGEFSNNNCDRNYTESAVPNSSEPDDSKPQSPSCCKFVGNYFSTWYETVDHDSVLAELEIKQTGRKNIFSLKWWLIQNKKKEAKTSFEGEGMIFDEILIGNYWGC
ncbi:MAG TPA: hypothetical protein VMD27_04665 [Candidatus Aquilonibacter sp.]|nr:hypothetical protein [Candidatus Aquilonibacter sp.]